MNLYFAKVDETFTYRTDCSIEGWQVRRRHMLVEAEDISAAWKLARLTAEANFDLGARPLAFEVREVTRISLPVAVSVHQQGGES